MNPMKEIQIEKVTLNIGCGVDKEKLNRAEKLLAKISSAKPAITKTHKRTTFGIAKKKPIGVMVTLRDKKAMEFLQEVFKGVDHKIKISQVNAGNFSIGVKEYIDLPNISYDPEIGILGMDVSVTLERKGYRVKRKKIRKSKIGKTHLISKQETIDWIKKMGVEISG